MTEWTVFTVLVAVVGLFFTVGAPVLKLNATITKLQTMLDNLYKDVETMRTTNAKSHDKIYTQLDNHETRISILEVKEQKHE